MEAASFSPGTLVKVVKGAFADRLGVVLDPEKAVDERCQPFPLPRPSYYWVMLAINDRPVPAHLFKDEIVAVGTEK
jgi:transcription antitermination factor NusG